MLIQTNTADLPNHLDEMVKVSGWVCACERKGLPGGAELIQLSLANRHGLIPVIVWPQHQPHIGPIALNIPVTATGKVRQYNRQTQVHAHQVAAVDPDSQVSASALLPYTPSFDAQPAHDRLIAFEEGLPEPLRGFLRRVLLDPRIGLPLLTCRASNSHHHSIMGGLLIHSTAMLDVAAQVAAAALPRDPLGAPMAQLGFFLHDLGKLRSVGDATRPSDPFVLRHETMTLDLLFPHLAWLDTQDREISLGLRYILEYVATPAASRPRAAKYLVAEIVTFLDHCSAASFQYRDLAALLHRRPTAWGPDPYAANDDEFEDDALSDIPG